MEDAVAVVKAVLSETFADVTDGEAEAVVRAVWPVIAASVKREEGHS